MAYKILEAHFEYVAGKLTVVAVLWQSNELGWVRASYCTRNQVVGYMSLSAEEKLSPELLQRVAGMGMNLPDRLKSKYFPWQNNWEK